MTTDHDFDRIATAWLAEGPDELSDRVLDSVTDQIHLTRQRRAMRVPRRLPTMTNPARLVAAAVVTMLVASGAFILINGPRDPSVGPPIASPSATPVVASPSMAALAVPALSETYTSARNGFTISYPAGWSATAAAAAWPPGRQLVWGDAALDTFRTGDARLVVSSQPLEPGQTPAAWYQMECDCVVETLEPVVVDGATGYRDADGDHPPNIGVAVDGVIFGAEVVSGGRGYQFAFDGHVDRAMFDALLATVRFVPPVPDSPTPLTGTFASPRYGYSIRYPSGWVATPATKPWLAGTDTLYGDPTLDTIGTSDARLAIASQPLAGTVYVDKEIREGQTPDEWLLANCGSSGATPASCGSRILIGGQSGWLDEDGAPASGGTVPTGGVIYDAAVVYKDRGYVFTLDGVVDRALFEALLASVTFDTDGAIDLPPLTKTFTSPTYGYSIGIGEGFVTTPATSTWAPHGSAGDTPMDVIGTTKDDPFVRVASIAIPAGTNFDEWLAVQFPAKAADSAAGTCARDDPATWPLIQVGNQVGRLDRHCHEVVALVEVGGRAYDFSWMYQITGTHHTLADWKELLKSVTFDPGAATP